MTSIKEKYLVSPIELFEVKDWLKYKHYAKRVPAIEYSFGLYDNAKLVGVCTFGPPPRVMNNGESIFKSYRVKTLELNRLVVNDGLQNNTLSFFVAKCLSYLPKPCCVVSYADSTFGHVGYIYQSTNWLYCGLNQVHEREWFLNGKEVHQRTLSSIGLTSHESKVEAGLTPGDYTKKHRYFMFLGSKKEKKKMLDELVYEVCEYPKGESKRYDAGYTPNTQIKLF